MCGSECVATNCVCCSEKVAMSLDVLCQTVVVLAACRCVEVSSLQ